MGTENGANKFDWTTLARVFRVVSILIVTIFVGIAVGYGLVSLTEKPWVQAVLGKNFLKESSIVTVALLIGMMDKLSGLLKTFWDYISEAGKEVTLPHCAALAGLVVYSVLVLSAWHDATDPAPPPASLVYLVKSDSNSVNPGGSSVEILPFLFYNRTEDEIPETDPRQIDELNKLVASLASCVGKGPNQDVAIEIQGFADENEFKGETQNDSDTHNYELANRRAKKLLTKINNIKLNLKYPPVDPLKFTVQLAKPWTSFPDMKISQRWLQAKSMSETGRDHDQGLFDRRAEILLNRAGVCQHLGIDVGPPSYVLSQK